MRIIFFFLVSLISSYWIFSQDSIEEDSYSEKVELLKFARDLRARAESENVSKLARDKLEELNRNTSLNLTTMGAENAISWEAYEILSEVASASQKDDDAVNDVRAISEKVSREGVEIDGSLKVNERPSRSESAEEKVFSDDRAPISPYVVVAIAVVGIVVVLLRARKR